MSGRCVRKMMLDLLAAAACGLTLVGVTAGVPQALECWLGVFFLANIYILLVSRIYIPVADQRRALSPFRQSQWCFLLAI